MLNSHHDKTVLYVSCLVCRCGLDDCSERVQTFSVGDGLPSCRESNSHRRSGRGTDRTVSSCLAWRRELASSLGGVVPRRKITQNATATPDNVRRCQKGFTFSFCARVFTVHHKLRIQRRSAVAPRRRTGSAAARPVESQIGARGVTLTGPPAGCLTHE